MIMATVFHSNTSLSVRKSFILQFHPTTNAEKCQSPSHGVYRRLMDCLRGVKIVHGLDIEKIFLIWYTVNESNEQKVRDLNEK